MKTFSSKGAFIRYDFTMMEDLHDKIRRAKGARAEVGLLRTGAARKRDKRRGGMKRNPDLGFVHEFGNARWLIPERSFLRMPLMLHLFPAVKKTDWMTMILKKGLPHALKALGAAAEAVIQVAFDTEGWGRWPKLKKSTIARKGHDQILIETGQLRKAISSRVVAP